MPFATHYRPLSFDDVVGQDNTVRIIRRMLESYHNKTRSLPSAILLEGPRGTGKTTLARIIAASLNCTFDGERPCTECRSCHEVQNGNNLAVMELDSATAGGIDAIREINQIARTKTRPGSYRVIILDEAHAITSAGNTALLKQLEESESVLYVLATTDPQNILQTVRSRCISFSLRQISEYDIQLRLRKIADTENLVVGDDVLEHLARVADGAMRDAISDLETLAQLPEIMLADAIQQFPDDLADFSKKFMEYAINGEHETGMNLIRETYRRHRNASGMIDAIIKVVSADALNDNSAIRQRKMLIPIITALWDVRVRSRGSQNSVSVLELLYWMISQSAGTIENA